jgi:hypothetical protein
MSQIEPNREWLLRYVLGELSEDETRQADERFFADDTFAGMIDEAYRDTLDSYATGEIRGSDKERVERAFFSGPRQAGRLKILEAMQAIPERTPEVAVAAVGAKVNSSPWFLSFWPVAASVAVLSVAIALVVHQRGGKMPEPVNQSAPTSEAVRGNAPEPAETPAVSTPGEKLYTILLLPDVSRGSEEAKEFAIPSSTNEVVFQAVLPSGQTGARFQIRLKGTKQAEAKIFSGLELRTIGNQKYVEFRVRGADLPADDYDVDVSTEPATSRPLEHFVGRIVRASTPQN